MPSAIALLLSYLIALIAAGHGAAPMGLLLMTGDLDSWWAPGKVIGWVGMGGLLIATFATGSNARRQLDGQFAASCVLYLSWLSVAHAGNSESGSFWTSFVLSAPFQIVFCWMAGRLMIQLVRSRKRSD